ncbi:hypothetical protein FOPE_10824 [Fonsecaea pedrosoi]|nr:hypothetical protein FOPE_10824 [Fonsecaea pedrosoi]
MMNLHGRGPRMSWPFGLRSAPRGTVVNIPHDGWRRQRDYRHGSLLLVAWPLGGLVRSLLVAVRSAILAILAQPEHSTGLCRLSGGKLTDALTPLPSEALKGRCQGLGRRRDISKGDGASELLARKHGLIMEADGYMDVRMHTTPARLNGEQG